MAFERLSKIFQELNVFADNKSVLEISHEKLNNHMEDDSLINSDATVTRTLAIDDETGEISEQRSLIMSLSALANGGGITKNNNVVSIKDGISTARFNMDTNIVKRKHYNFEEGIVQFYTLMALEKLYRFIEKDNVSDNMILNKFKKGYPSYDFNCYIIQVQLLEALTKDAKFKRLLDYTFEEEQTPAQLALYFNDVMGDGSVFTSLSKEIDNFYDNFHSSEDVADAALKKIASSINNFIMRSKGYKKI